MQGKDIVKYITENNLEDLEIASYNAKQNEFAEVWSISVDDVTNGDKVIMLAVK